MIFQMFLCERLECIYSAEHNFFLLYLLLFLFYLLRNFMRFHLVKALGPRVMMNDLLVLSCCNLTCNPYHQPSEVQRLIVSV
ncbi:hypothetical protein VNO80_07751 [Phaseolus coccineus]|uniref:Uncharacterized protein n=1 Tax=Phaseolus coccineus TaxID=3886 RepID=A0AAN9NP95_PHACN